MSLERPIDRVIDLIAELENGDPTVPIEIWVLNETGAVDRRCVPTSVLQITPSRLDAMGLADDRPGSGPFPTVIFTTQKRHVQG